MSIISFVIFIELILTVSSLTVEPRQLDECCESYCYNSDISRDQYRNFATKTPYRLARGTSEQYAVSGEASIAHNVFRIQSVMKPINLIYKGCEAEKLWILSRHGTRLPSSQSMPLLKELEQVYIQVLTKSSVRFYIDSIWN